MSLFKPVKDAMPTQLAVRERALELAVKLENISLQAPLAERVVERAQRFARYLREGE